MGSIFNTSVMQLHTGAGAFVIVQVKVTIRSLFCAMQFRLLCFGSEI